MQIPSAFQFFSEEAQKYSASTPASLKTRPSKDPFSPPTLFLEEPEEWDLQAEESENSSVSASTWEMENELSRMKIRTRSQGQDFSILGFLTQKVKQNKQSGRLRLRSTELDGNLKEETFDY